MKKFDKGHIYSILLSSLFSSLVAPMMFLEIFENEDLGINPFIILGGAYLVAYAIQVIYTIFFVLTSGYEVTEAELRCRRGILFRKTSVLAYDKIHAVNKKQTLFQRFFHIATLTVDSGATGAAHQAEITIIEKSSVVDALMEEIKRRQAGEPIAAAATEAPPAKENLYRFDSKLKWIYNGLNLTVSLVTVAILVLAAALGLAVVNGVIHNTADLWLGLVFLSILSLVIVSVVTLIASIVNSFVHYHDFRIHRNRDDIEISYGLLSRHTNSFKFRRIKAVKLLQGPIKRLFGFATAQLEVVGYGGTSSESNDQNQEGTPGILLPLCKDRELNALLERILPGYSPAPIVHKAKSYWAFVLFPALYVGLGFLLAAAAAILVLTLLQADLTLYLLVLGLGATAALVILLLVALSGLLQYWNAGLAMDENKLTIQNGGLIRRRTVIRWKDIIGIEGFTTPLRARKGIRSYQIHFFSNALTNTVEVHNLDAALEAQLQRYLRD